MANDPIEHVMVLLLENRSFDPTLAGSANMRARYTSGGVNKYGAKRSLQQPGAARTTGNDPVHETSDVLVQLGGQKGVPPTGGFVIDSARKYHQLTDPSEVMKYHEGGALSAIHALAEAFTVCEQWHAWVPGPTWSNRLFAGRATSGIRRSRCSSCTSGNLKMRCATDI